jgi:hypothetical protein
VENVDKKVLQIKQAALKHFEGNALWSSGQQGSLSLVSTTEELLGRKSSGSGLNI